MLAFLLGQTKVVTTVRAFSVNVGLSVSEFVLEKLEKSAEPFVFSSALSNVS